jgi:DNA-directed RNA polymerase specialized sigma24 family protein
MPPDDATAEGSLDGLRKGNTQAAQALWDRYFERLVRLAGARLPGYGRRVYDGEDVALSAMRTFYRRLGEGQFPQLSDRDDLWRLLIVLTSRKATQYRRHENRRKRGGGRVLGESALGLPGAAVESVDALAEIIGREPTAEFAALLLEEHERLLAKFEDPDIRTVVRLKLEGDSCQEIAAKLGTSLRTVERKLRIIRLTWAEEMSGPEQGRTDA